MTPWLVSRPIIRNWRLCGHPSRPTVLTAVQVIGYRQSLLKHKQVREMLGSAPSRLPLPPAACLLCFTDHPPPFCQFSPPHRSVREENRGGGEGERVGEGVGGGGRRGEGGEGSWGKFGRQNSGIGGGNSDSWKEERQVLMKEKRKGGKESRKEEDDCKQLRSSAAMMTSSTSTQWFWTEANMTDQSPGRKRT